MGWRPEGPRNGEGSARVLTKPTHATAAAMNGEAPFLDKHGKPRAAGSS